MGAWYVPPWLCRLGQSTHGQQYNGHLALTPIPSPTPHLRPVYAAFLYISGIVAVAGGG